MEPVESNNNNNKNNTKQVAAVRRGMQLRALLSAERTDGGGDLTINKVSGYDDFRVFLAHNSKYLIISVMNSSFVYYRIVFNNKTGKFLFVSKDIINSVDSNRINQTEKSGSLGVPPVQLINKFNFILNPSPPSLMSAR